MQATRTEQDSLGAVEVPVNALYGAQTQRAVDNFRISGQPMPSGWIQALIQIKRAAASVNARLGELDSAKARALEQAADRVLAGEFSDQFPVDRLQTGSGTSSNMNANEVLAQLASSDTVPVHPNDDVNCGQSSNDVIPSTNQLAAAQSVQTDLLPSLNALSASLDALSQGYGQLLKTGRTHLMDAMPLRVHQEVSGWQGVLTDIAGRLERLLPELACITLGGTAVGTGVNAHPDFGKAVAHELAGRTGLPITCTDNTFAAQSGQNAQLALSGELRNLATWLIKISNDLRAMNSGPLAGLAEGRLPALQPGSSIMPGKVNPVIPEAVIQAAHQVMGLDLAIALSAQNGQFQLNTSLPLIGANINQSLELLSNAMTALAHQAIDGFEFDPDTLARPLARNPILATALNPVIGYQKAAEIAKTAYREQRPVLDVALELTDLGRQELQSLLDPANLV